MFIHWARPAKNRLSIKERRASNAPKTDVFGRRLTPDINPFLKNILKIFTYINIYFLTCILYILYVNLLKINLSKMGEG